ncbi:dihydrofolate reductase family protein [Streptomyces sp. AC495_CC817]|uniref:dihydrofolate reductase family protein n=1 Tax=Streptomyces sp. AC495_CC817 TaxID=2823900 RepID=UPI001C27A9F7|nr:dihydrofolate reductase family protein [Streptomyces sp. AC495_CC817]
MTRELVYTGFITVDGVVDSPGGVAEGHPGGGWVFDTAFDPAAYSLKGEELAETTALVFGRRSYEAFSAFWPGSEDHAAYRDLPKYVVSSTIGEGDLVDGWGPTTILRSAADVARLKTSGEGALFIHGSAELGRRLGEEGLIDRYNLLVFPYLLSGGKSIFSTEEHERRKLRLLDSAAYENGVVKLVYAVER